MEGAAPLGSKAGVRSPSGSGAAKRARRTGRATSSSGKKEPAPAWGPEKEGGESACNPSSVEGDHLSRMPVAWHLQRPTRGRGGPPHHPSCSVLLRVGFAKPASRLAAGELLPHRFSLTCAGRRRFVFCGTFLRVAPTGYYPAPCPVELGLSSDAAFRRCTRDHPAGSPACPSSEKDGAVCRAPHALSHTFHTDATTRF